MNADPLIPIALGHLTSDRSDMAKGTIRDNKTASDTGNTNFLGRILMLIVDVNIISSQLISALM